MAGFTAELQDPGQIGGAGSGGGGQSGLGMIGGALTGVANIANLVLGRMKEDDSRQAGNDVSKKLTDLVTNNFGKNPDGTPFVGDPPADPAKAAAAASPVVTGAMDQLDRLHQANMQGRLNPTELFTRGSVIVQDAINQNPLFATEIRQAAQAVLGTQPTTELVRLAEQDANASEAANRQITVDLVQKAANAGVTFQNPDGTFDFAKMADAGTQLAFQEHQLDLTLKQAQLSAAAAPAKPTDKELLNAEVMPFVKGANVHFQNVQDGLLSSVPAFVASAQNADDPTKLKMASQAIAVQENYFNTWLNGQIVHNNLSPDAAKQVKDYYKGFFDDYRQLFSGDLSYAAATARMLKELNDKGGIDFNQSSPALAQLHYAGGDQAVAAVINTAVGTNPDLQKRLNGEVNNLTQFRPASPIDVIHNTANVLGGGPYTPAAEQNPDMQKKVLQGLIGTINTYQSNPDTLDPKSLNAWGNATQQIAGVGLMSNDPRELQNAANTLNSPALIRTFQRYAKDPTQANNVHITATGVIALNTRSLQRGLPVLSQGSDTTLPVDITGNAGVDTALNVGGNAITNAFSFGATGLLMPNGGPMPQLKVHASSAFNPVTGRIELQLQGVGPDGKPMQLSPSQTARAMADFKGYTDQIASYNRSLDTVAAMTPYSLGRESSLKPLEVKQVITAGSGFPNKAGTQAVPMPTFLQKPQPPAGTPAVNPKPAATGSLSGGPSSDYASLVRHHESGTADGNYSIVNPFNKKAAGAYQFMPDTFRAMVRTLPDGKNMSDSEIDALRNSSSPRGKDFQDRAFQAYTMQNTAELNAHGIYHVDNTALELAHWFGGAGARKFLNAPMNSRVEDVFGPAVVRQNPVLKGKTLKEVYNDLAKQFGGNPVQ